MNTTSNYPIDPTGPLTIGTIPDAVDRLVAATAEQSWRDYIDQLTAQQVADLTVMESAGSSFRHLIAEAVEAAEGNRIASERFAHIQPPAGAVRVYRWNTGWSIGDDGGWRREFEGTTHRVGRALVGVEGVQRGDGAVQAFVAVEANESHMDAEQTRALAAALMAAADELDRLTRQ